ncbi:hypothetical protein LguiB_034001 [Lonicera macranthoides]
MTIFGQISEDSDGEEGFFSTCFGYAFKISHARIEPLISSTWPFACTIRITSRAPHGRMQEMQHLMVFFMVFVCPLSLEYVGCPRGGRRERESYFFCGLAMSFCKK